MGGEIGSVNDAGAKSGIDVEKEVQISTIVRRGLESAHRGTYVRISVRTYKRTYKCADKHTYM